MLSTKFPSISDVKQFQANLILAAGFKVTEMPEMPRSKIVSEMHSAYLRLTFLEPSPPISHYFH